MRTGNALQHNAMSSTRERKKQSAAVNIRHIRLSPAAAQARKEQRYIVGRRHKGVRSRFGSLRTPSTDKHLIVMTIACAILPAPTTAVERRGAEPGSQSDKVMASSRTPRSPRLWAASTMGWRRISIFDRAEFMPTSVGKYYGPHGGNAGSAQRRLSNENFPAMPFDGALDDSQS